MKINEYTGSFGLNSTVSVPQYKQLKKNSDYTLSVYLKLMLRLSV